MKRSLLPAMITAALLFTPHHLLAQQGAAVIWRDPGAVEKLDFAAGPGGVAGAPNPPFKFLEEDKSASNPKEEHYDISIKCGERALLPAVREAAKDAIIIADGFSCREQIAQTTNRRALHPSQVIQMAMRGDESRRDYPEQALLRAESNQRPAWQTAAMIGAGASACGALVIRARRRG